MNPNVLQQAHGLLAWVQIWISCWYAMLQSCLCNPPWPWRWASSQPILKCSKRSPIWWSLPLNVDFRNASGSRIAGHPLPSLLQLLRGPLARPLSRTSTLEARHLLQHLGIPVFELLSFPIYHILVIIFHSKQAGLLLYVNSHTTSDPGSLEKSRGTLPLMETREYK